MGKKFTESLRSLLQLMQLTECLWPNSDFGGWGDAILKCSIVETKNSNKKVLLSPSALERVCLQEELFVQSDVCDSWPVP